MSKELAPIPASNLDVISTEVAEVVESAKKYAAGFMAAAQHRKGYAVLLGVKLNQLKEIAPHGLFEKLAPTIHPDICERWRRELMALARALAPKTALSAVLKSGQLLLDLSEQKKSELFAEVEQKMGDKGIREYVLAWRKKQHQAKLKDAAPPTVEEERARKLESIVRSVHELRQKMALLAKTKALALLPDDELEALEEDRITFGRHIAELTKHRKGARK